MTDQKVLDKLADGWGQQYLGMREIAPFDRDEYERTKKEQRADTVSIDLVIDRLLACHGKQASCNSRGGATIYVLGTLYYRKGDNFCHIHSPFGAEFGSATFRPKDVFKSHYADGRLCITLRNCDSSW